MAIITDSRRKVNRLTTPEIKSEKASCAVVFHRYDNVDIVRLLNANVTNDQSISGKIKGTESGDLNNRSTFIIRQDIVRCTVTNDKSGVGGSFSVVIKKGKEFHAPGPNTNKDVGYLKNLNPGDWITIYMKRVKEIAESDLSSIDQQSGLKMLGIIETVRMVEVDDPGTAAPKLEFTITGRSFGKVFDTNIFFNPVINQASMQTLLGAAFLTDSSGTTKRLAGNTPDAVVKQLAKFYLGGAGTQHLSNENWYVPTSVAQLFHSTMKNKPLSRSFIDLITTDRVGLQQYARNKFVSATALPGVALIASLPTTGTIWSVMQFLRNEPSNELYTELTPDSSGKLHPSLILRQLPFSNKKGQETNVFAADARYNGGKTADAGGQKTYFTDLPKLSIVSADIRSKNIGKSDHERINYVVVTPKIFDGVSLDIAFVAGSNPPSIQRYGLKLFQTQSPYVMGAAQNQNEGIKQACSRMVSLLEDWFFLSHNLFNGTIVADGVDGFVEVGSNLYISDIQHLFHIEGYTHNYSISPIGGSEYTTEFRVSRGQRFDSTANKSSFIGDSHTSNETTTIVTSFVARGV